MKHLFCDSLCRHSSSKLLEVYINVIYVHQVTSIEEYWHSRSGAKFRRSQTIEYSNDRNTPTPCRANFRPHIGALQSPGRQKHNQLISSFQKKLRSPPQNHLLLRRRPHPKTALRRTGTLHALSAWPPTCPGCYGL